jgi:hypothetical protein
VPHNGHRSATLDGTSEASRPRWIDHALATPRLPMCPANLSDRLTTRAAVDLHHTLDEALALKAMRFEQLDDRRVFLVRLRHQRSPAESSWKVLTEPKTRDIRSRQLRAPFDVIEWLLDPIRVTSDSKCDSELDTHATAKSSQSEGGVPRRAERRRMLRERQTVTPMRRRSNRPSRHREHHLQCYQLLPSTPRA